MEILTSIIELFQNYTFRNVIIGSALLGMVSGVLSVFTVLKGESLLSEALSHSVLPGIGIAFILTGYKDPLALAIGATIIGFLSVACIFGITQNSLIKKDAAMAVVLSSFFGLGIVILTFIARSGNSQQAGLEDYLLGSAATFLQYEVLIIAIMTAIILAIATLFYKELKLLCFDSQQAFHLGFSPRKLHWVLLTLIVLTVIVGLKLVGTVLMAALLIGPAIAARFWSHSFFGVVVLSALFGSMAGVSGSLLSISELALPTGPTIVLSLFGILVVSIVFGGAKGVIRNVIPEFFRRGNWRG